ncbi:alpha/beta hydrolase [Naasia aerilata]|uniref:alpha/beta hydrolase n=1 Tax=Naasia aerilata TaxID=1162966 RepID=UPI0025743449|nr:alpha/beta hydrolase [Naasia aerilata]
MSTLTDVDVPVQGGALRVAVWEPEGTATATVLAIHGITATSRAWADLAEALPDVRIVAPDLRGRGRSNTLPPPYGLVQHAGDLVRVLDALHLPAVPVVAHSMGAFVAVLLAHAAPDRVESLLLVDGGFPLILPEGVSMEDGPAKLLGPAFDRLGRIFPSRESYREFWQGHPAFPHPLGRNVEAYVDYDLDPVPGGFSPSANADAVGTDALQQFGDERYLAALRGLRMPVTVLRAPRGLLDQPGGLYAAGRLNGFVDLVPSLRLIEVPDVNHYTIVMSAAGARDIAAALTAQSPH